MRVLRYPGLVIRDVDLSQIISGTASSVGAIVGGFARGPVNERVLVSSVRELVTIFGNPDDRYGYACHTAIAALSSMRALWVTRVAPSNAGWAAVKVNRVGAGSTDTSSLTLTSEPTVSSVFPSEDPGALVVYTFPGEKGNSLRITISNTEFSNDRFSLQVYEVVDSVPILRESYPYLTRKRERGGFGNSEFVEDVINTQSKYIRVLSNPVSPEVLPKTVNLAPLSGGSDGTPPTISESMISSGWDLYSDPETVEVDLLLSAGYTASGSNVVPAKLLSIASSRRDCFAIIDVPATIVHDVSQIKSWVGTIQGNSFGAVYCPWVKVIDTMTLGSQIVVPPSGFVAQVFANREFNRGPWFAPAGLNDGIISSDVLPVLGLTKNYTSAEQGELQSNVSSINYIKQFPGIGFAVWGQRTLHPKESALRYVNIRRLLIFVERALKRYTVFQIFEQNNEYTREIVSNAISQFLERIKAMGGLYSYRVVCDLSNNPPHSIDSGVLKVDVFLQPTRAIEEIQLNLIVTRTGVSLSELLRG